MAPALGALVKEEPEKPTILMTWPTPGWSSAMSATRRITASVRESEAPGGNCAAMIR